MIFQSPLRFFLFSSSLLFGFAAVAAENAQDWLMRISHAARHLEYEGVFVYQHDTQLETMRIFHKPENGKTRERLVSLNGAPREIIRDDREVRCYWPDKNSVMVEYRKADSKNFPAIPPERLQDLDRYYTLQLGKTERIAGRAAQRVTITPADQYRYGYHLWADRETGLLLKAALLDTEGKALEQFMFTQLNIGVKIPAAALAPGMAGEGMVWYREEGDTKSVSEKPGWAAMRLPKGFRLSTHMTRRIPMRNRTAEHLVYTDGLATVSVFVEKPGKDAKPFMEGLSHMGAVHAHGARLEDYQVMAVGEVPADTVTLIGGSVVPAR